MAGCWVEVDLGAIRDNLYQVQQLVAPAGVLAVVKANAYGHGLIPVAKCLAQQGATGLAVSSVGEAVSLRGAGLTLPVLVLTPPLPDEGPAVIEHQLETCLSDETEAHRLNEAATSRQCTVRVHLKLNCGMGRLGVLPSVAPETARLIQSLPGLELAAVWTHFSMAGTGLPETTAEQWKSFQSALAAVRALPGLAGVPAHCANSAALVRFPETRLSMVRPGTLLYGQYPTPAVCREGEKIGLQLRDPWVVKARIIALRPLQSGQSVGYGGEWRARRPTILATLAVGYADGLAMEPRARTDSAKRIWGQAIRRTLGLGRAADPHQVHIEGVACPVVGRIAMQQCSVDVTDWPDHKKALDGQLHVRPLRVGDEVVLHMRRTAAAEHLPRVYHYVTKMTDTVWKTADDADDRA